MNVPYVMRGLTPKEFEKLREAWIHGRKSVRFDFSDFHTGHFLDMVMGTDDGTQYISDDELRRGNIAAKLEIEKNDGSLFDGNGRVIQITKNTIGDAAKEIAEETTDAYSFGKYYSKREWTRITKYLLELGYSRRAVKEILYSKHMRWASDHNNSRHMTLEKFKNYYEHVWKHTGKTVISGILEMLMRECGLSAEDFPPIMDY